MTKTSTANTVRKGHCPSCGEGRSADIVGSSKESWSDAEDGINGDKEYFILTCRGCETTYFQTDETFSEDYNQWRDVHGDEHWELNHKIFHYPAPIKRKQPDWSVQISIADRDLGRLFEDIYGALNADLRVPAAISVRTTIDKASELLGVDPSLTFESKLNALQNLGKIGGDEKGVLSVLIDAGSAAAHRGWRPSATDLDGMVSIMEGFLNRAFVVGDLAAELKKKVPPKPPKKTKKKSK